MYYNKTYLEIMTLIRFEYAFMTANENKCSVWVEHLNEKRIYVKDFRILLVRESDFETQ